MRKHNALNAGQQDVLDFFSETLAQFKLPRIEDLKKLYQSDTDFRSYTKHFRSTELHSEELDQGFVGDASSHFQKLENFFPEVKKISELANLKLKKFVKAHAIYSPPQAQGLPLHYDFRNGVVYQREGQKRWQIWRPFRSELTAAALNFDQQNKVFEEWIKVSECREFILQEGDFLFVSVGSPHRAFSQSVSSLHYNFALHETAEDLKSPY